MVRRRSTVRFRKGAPINDSAAAQDPVRRRRTVLFQRYVANPPMKAAVWLGLIPGHMIVETVGRKTGKRRRTVVGCAVSRAEHDSRSGDAVWVVAEQGRHAGYVRNLEAQPRVRIRLGRRWLDATAAVVDDDDPQARLDASFDPKHAALVRRAGTSLLSVRFDLDRAG